jgi:hypothetical protein
LSGLAQRGVQEFEELQEFRTVSEDSCERPPELLNSCNSFLSAAAQVDTICARRKNDVGS